MSGMMVYGTRPSNRGDPTVLRDKWLPSLKFLAARKLAQVIQESVHQNFIGEEPGNARQWETAQKYLKTDPLPLVKELYEKFLVKDTSPDMFCSHCTVVLKNTLNFQRIQLTLVQEMFMSWLCDPRWNPAYMEHHRPSLGNTYVSKIIMSWNEEKAMYFLPKPMENQPVGLKLKDEEAFDYFAKNFHARELVLNRRVGHNNINKFVKFLQSQSHCLQEITFHASFSLHDDHPEFDKMIWNVLAELRHLTKLQWVSSSLIRVSIERKIKPLKQLLTLKLKIEDTHQNIDQIPVERMFPVLEKYCLLYKFGNMEPLPPTRNLREVTRVDIIVTDEPIPANLELFPANFIDKFSNLKVLSISTNFKYLPEQLQFLNLTQLQVGGVASLSFEQLKAPFTSMPNLIYCDLYAEKVSNYDEKKFIHFLADSIQDRRKLICLYLEIEQHPVKMTGATACAILRYSQIEIFGNLSKFKFSSDELEELETLARQKYLTILPAYWNNEHQKNYSCDSGKHF